VLHYYHSHNICRNNQLPIITSFLGWVQSTVMSMSVHLFVCLLAYLRNYTAELRQILRILPLAVARSSRDVIVIHCVLPVCGWRHVFTHHEHNCIDCNQILLNYKNHPVHIVGCTSGGKICYLRLRCYVCNVWQSFLSVTGHHKCQDNAEYSCTDTVATAVI